MWSTLAALEKGKGTPETRVVSDGVEGGSGYPDGSAELIGDVPRHLEETVEAVTLVPRERVRQLTAEQIGGASQFQEETVDDELLVKQMIEVRKAPWSSSSSYLSRRW